MVFKRWQIFAGTVLILAATAASALSLGRVRGTALLGRGLDVSVQATLDAQEAIPEASCFAVELFYGDTRVAPGSISVSPERSTGGEFRVRVRSLVAVDEPVVTLFLRASCGASVSRRFVLLTEAVTEPESGSVPFASSPNSSIPSLPTLPAAAPRAVLPASEAAAQIKTGDAANATAARQARRQARERAVQARKERQDARSQSSALGVSEISRQARSSVVRQAEKTKTSAPRLQLDLLDLTSSSVNLRGSAELISAPSNDEAVRRQALALWRTLNASPEEALQSSQRLEAIEGQLRAAMDQSKRQSQDIATLSTELQAAQRARYLNPLVYALALLALAALAACAWLWRRSYSGIGTGLSKPWWRSATEKSAPKDEAHLWGHLADSSISPLGAVNGSTEKTRAASGFDASQTEPGRKAAAAPTSVLAQKSSKDLRFTEQPSATVDFTASPVSAKPSTGKITPLGNSAAQGRGGSMGPVDSSPPPSLMGQRSNAGKFSDSRGFAQSDFAPSMFSGGSRVVAAEELFDIQEQADFFMSLDQPEQAIEVLKNHITDNVETSALAYMDLFDIYHRTSRENEYAQLREEFNRVFNAQVPEFSRYGGKSNGLEGFPQVLSSIQAVWRTPQQALETIEESIFRQPDQDQPPLDMLAYRELMLLYAMSKELARPNASYALLPATAQAGVVPAIEPLDFQSDVADLDLSQDFLNSIPPKDVDMLGLDSDGTISLPPGVSLTAGLKSKDGNSLDFDVSDLDLQDDTTISGFKKKR